MRLTGVSYRLAVSKSCCGACGRPPRKPFEYPVLLFLVDRGGRSRAGHCGRRGRAHVQFLVELYPITCRSVVLRPYPCVPALGELERNLVWSHARLRSIKVHQRRVHHDLCHLPIRVDPVFVLANMGLPRQADPLGPGWRLGAEPMQVMFLVFADLCSRCSDHR